ncbi:MAG: hypothetical protein H6R26_1710 [Proteobacteria bacterium]|nr:hypothetical protein [Pseudomonadota bacterium]
MRTMHDRTVFFISDGTGITAESLGHLLGHFPDVHFRQIRIPFVDSEEKVDEAIRRVNLVAEEDAVRPVVIATFIRADWRARLREAAAMHLDVFSLFVDPLSAELGHEPTGELGKSRGVSGNSYFARIDAINYTLNHDDGISASGLEQAQVILVGVSRCGKTPTCLYLAMQFGIKAANYPLTPEDFERHSLPIALSPHRGKLFGLTIRPERLHSVRSERRPGSHYASLDNCRSEVRTAEGLMQRAGIPWLDSTTHSIEEIATSILQRTQIPATESYL